MPEVLAVPLLHDAVVARFTADATTCNFHFGWREPPQQFTGPRIVMVPGNELGDFGEVLPPKYPGRNPRALAAMNELFHVVISTRDLTDPENERLQYTACRLLFDAWARAAVLYAGNALQFVSGTWLVDRETRRYGASLVVTCALDAMIPDEVPGTGLSELFDNVPTNADVDVTELDNTENVYVDNGALLLLPTENLLIELDARVGVTAGVPLVWADQSGNDFDATQTDPARQPTITTNPTLGDVLRFANPDFLDLAPSGFAAASGPLTFYCVCDPDMGGTQSIIDIDAGRVNVGLSAGSPFLFDGVALRTGTDIAPSAPGHFAFVRDGTSVELFAGGVADSGGALTCAGDTPIGGAAKIGSSRNATASFFVGDIAFLAIYTEAHDADQRAAVWAYINQEWDV